ncbi:MAG TPA: c-type cytochrome [Acetobacteraceae bacterium]|jgi:cytochrome c
MRYVEPWLMTGAAIVAPYGGADAQFTVPAPQAVAPTGAELFANQCGTCHSAKPNDTPRQGPNLFGVFGRKAGSFPGFHYSPGFAQADFVWDEVHLDAWLTKPQNVIKGAVMAYQQPDATNRKTIIVWLREQH